jgi:hypothetical protein
VGLYGNCVIAKYNHSMWRSLLKISTKISSRKAHDVFKKNIFDATDGRFPIKIYDAIDFFPPASLFSKQNFQH